MKTSLRLSCVFLSLACSSAQPVLAAADETTASRRVVVISAQDTVRIPATRARLTAMIEMQAESPAAAQSAIRQRSQTVLEFLQRSKVERLQAGAMALHPVYGERRRQPPDLGQGTEIVGYRAQWSATFEVEAPRAGEIADGVVSAGASRIAGFEFIAADDALAKAQQQALRGAALRARENAHAVLDALGYPPLEVVRVDVNSNEPVHPLGRRVEMMAMSVDQGMPPTAVEPGVIEASGSVTLEVAY